MTVTEIMSFLEAHGEESIKKTLLKHGVKEPFFGVKVENLKVIQKKVKTDYQLAKALYATGNADAMYLAGLIADDAKMTREDLEAWVAVAVSNNISDYTVPWVAAGSPVGYELAKEWINDPREHVAAAGWSTLRDWVALRPDSELNMSELKALLKRVEDSLNKAPDRVKPAKRGFAAAAGIYIKSLTDEVLEMAGSPGGVQIRKAKDRGKIGVNKKMVKC